MVRNENHNLTITRDPIFGHVFSKPENCLHLLRSILPERGITEVEVTPQKQLNKKLWGRNVIMDLWAKDKQGEIFDVEMQTSKQKCAGVRFRYYQSVADQDSLKSGESFEQIRETYIIFIYPFDPFGEGKYIYESVTLLDKGNPDSYANTKTHWISINANGYKGKITPELKEFLDYIKHGLTESSSSFIKKIDQERLDYIRSPEWREAKMSLDMLLADERAEARKEGKAEGRVEGRAEGKLEAQRIGVKKFVKRFREINQSDAWIMSKLITDYGADFSKSELEKLMQEAEREQFLY